MHQYTHAPIAHIYIPREDILYETLGGLTLGFSYMLTDSLTQSQKLAYIYKSNVKGVINKMASHHELESETVYL